MIVDKEENSLSVADLQQETLPWEGTPAEWPEDLLWPEGIHFSHAQFTRC